jgi:predicted SAM-dependent methyltransferase
MLSRNMKILFYLLASPLMKISGFFYRQFLAPRIGMVKVQLGPGKKNYLDGWINVDANAFTAKCDVWANIIDELPFHPETVDAVYSHHVVEHLPNLANHFLDVFRCLKPGGIYRVGGPNGDIAIKKFLENDHKYWWTI